MYVSVNNRPLKKIDSCSIEGLFSVLLNVFVSKMKEDIVSSINPHFNKSYVDYT